MAIRGILFDNDGTIVDTHDLILDSMRYSTRTFLGRVIPDEQLMAKVGIPLADQMLDFTSDLAERDELLRVYREYNHAHHDQTIRLFPGVAEGLAALHAAGFKMGDVIIAFEDKEVKTLEEFTAAKKNYSAGDTATFTVVREGEEIELTLTFDSVPQKTEEEKSEDPNFDPNQGGQNPYYYYPPYYDYFDDFFGSMFGMTPYGGYYR